MELSTPTPDRRAFLSVIPLPEGGFRIWKFEVPRSALQEDRYLSPDEVLNGTGQTVDKVDDAERVLAEMGADSNQLTEPWKTDYPL